MGKFIELLPGFLVYGEFIAIVFVVWVVLLYIINNRKVRWFLATVFSVFIFELIIYLEDGYLDKLAGVGALFLTGVAIISVCVFEEIRVFLLKKNKKK